MQATSTNPTYLVEILHVLEDGIMKVTHIHCGEAWHSKLEPYFSSPSCLTNI